MSAADLVYQLLASAMYHDGKNAPAGADAVFPLTVDALWVAIDYTENFGHDTTPAPVYAGAIRALGRPDVTAAHRLALEGLIARSLLPTA